jgi:hypothetical protein
MANVLVCCKNDPRGRTGLIYSEERIPEYVVNNDINYSKRVIPEEYTKYIHFFMDKSPVELGKYINDMYDLDCASDTFIADYKRFLIKDIIDKRDKLLIETDWTRVDDNGLSYEMKEQWRVYRQALRDLPGNIEYDENLNVSNVTWPLPHK